MLEILLSPCSILITSIIGLVYWYLTRNYSYFTKQGIKGPKPVWLLGNLLEQISANTVQLDNEWRRKYGPTYGYYRGLTPVLTLTDPDHIRQLTVTDFDKFHDRFSFGNVEHEIGDLNLFSVKGDKWKKIRTLTTPTFTTNKLKKMFSMVSECSLHLVDYLQRQTDEHGELNLKSIYGGYTMEVIASCAFATKVNAIEDNNSRFVQSARDFFIFRPLRLFAGFFFPLWLNNLLGIHAVTSEEGIDYILSVCKQIIKDRKANRDSKDKYHDFLQLLLNAEHGVDDHDGEDAFADYGAAGNLSGSSLAKGTKLTENEVIAQAFAFLLAGYETTATTLLWLSYELSLNAEVQDRLYEEIVSVVGNDHIDYDLLSELPLLDAVIAETLRLHNPITRMLRECTEDCTLGGIEITKGVNIEVSIQAIHHSADNYPEPLKFDPDRFMPENKHNIKPFTYLPFGYGPRTCIGMRFALMEVKIAVTHLIRSFKLTRSDRNDQLPYLNNPWMNIPEAMFVGIEKR